jgi:hypothetical protein
MPSCPAWGYIAGHVYQSQDSLESLHVAMAGHVHAMSEDRELHFSSGRINASTSLAGMSHLELPAGLCRLAPGNLPCLIHSVIVAPQQWRESATCCLVSHWVVTEHRLS